MGKENLWGRKIRGVRQDLGYLLGLAGLNVSRFNIAITTHDGFLGSIDSRVEAYKKRRMEELEVREKEHFMDGAEKDHRIGENISGENRVCLNFMAAVDPMQLFYVLKGDFDNSFLAKAIRIRSERKRDKKV